MYVLHSFHKSLKLGGKDRERGRAVLRHVVPIPYLICIVPDRKVEKGHIVRQIVAKEGPKMSSNSRTNSPKKPVPANTNEQVSQGQDHASRAKASHAAHSGSSDGGARRDLGHLPAFFSAVRAIQGSPSYSSSESVSPWDRCR